MFRLGTHVEISDGDVVVEGIVCARDDIGFTVDAAAGERYSIDWSAVEMGLVHVTDLDQRDLIKKAA